MRYLLTAEVSGLPIARRVASDLTSSLPGGSGMDHRRLRLGLAVAHYLSISGPSDLAAELCAVGYRASTALQDVPLRAAFSKLSETLPVSEDPLIENCAAIVRNAGQPALARQYGTSTTSDEKTKETLQTLWMSLERYI